MTRYGLRWVDHAREQYDLLSPEAKQKVDATLRRVREDPRIGSYAPYEEQWTITFNTWGLIVYSVEDRWAMVTVLRVTSIG